MQPQIGLQLYTLRDQFAQDFHGTIQRVAEIGFAGVETAFFSENITPKEAQKRFDQLGLTVISAHCPLPIGNDQEFTLSLLDDLQCRTAIWHGWPQDERYQTLSGVSELIELYNSANAIANSNGIRLGIHNHWWEFEEVEGQLPYNLLRRHLHPNILFEIDTYWAKTAGQDPVTLVTDFGDRAPLLHIKDGPAIQGADMVAVGSGTLDIPAIVRASAGSVEWLIVELDSCAGDIWQALEQSHRFLTETLSKHSD